MSEIECWSCRNPITTRFTGTVSMTHTRMCGQCTTPPRQRAPTDEVQQRQQGAAHTARHRSARREAAQRAVEGSGEPESEES